MMKIDFSEFRDKKLLVVGGAGFVGSNLVLKLLNENPRELLIVDNLLSSDISNVVRDERVKFIFGSIAEDDIFKAFAAGPRFCLASLLLSWQSVLDS